MRITQEADYALRITSVLATSKAPIGAPQIAEAVSIPPRFAMKILRKLSLLGIATATRGVTGGYSLQVDPYKLSIRQVIEAIDGPIEVQKCLNEEYACSRNPQKSGCRYHNMFNALNEAITQRLGSVSIGEMANDEIPLEMIIEKVK